MANIIKTVFQFRRDTTDNWVLNKDVIPAAGEPCFDIGLNTLKIGNGVTTYENLEAIGGVKIDTDGNSLVFEDGILELAGFEAAEAGAQPRKNAEGKLEWVVPSTETVEGLQSAVAGLQSDVESIHGQIDILNGDETVDGSIKKVVNDGINEWASIVTDDGKVNTVKEFIDYVNEHGEMTEAIVNDIEGLKALVGDKSVDERIDEYASKADSLYEHVHYEISDKPEGTIVSYRDKEIRVFCPEETKWELQNSGVNSDANKYYIGFKAYAPEGAVSFKEDLAEVIADQTMYTFDGNDFAGVDAQGRKYSIVWLPVAVYDANSGIWTYHGDRSNTGKYIGWHYSVAWFDAVGRMISTDTIRINLTNKNCHNVIEPYYMVNVVKGVKMGDSLLDMVDGVVSIPDNGGLKGSDEVIVDEDGTLRIGAISIDKLVSTDGSEIVFDGGSASN